MFRINFICIVFFITLTSFFSDARAGIDIPDARPFGNNATVIIKGDTILFDGLITRQSEEKLVGLLRHTEIKNFSVNSMGGDVDSAIDIAEIIHERKINIIVRTVCASACANYIFPAGHKKLLGENSYLLWHGSANSPAGQLQITSDDKKMSRNDFIRFPAFIRIKRREKDFYQKLNINPRLPFCPQLQDDYLINFPEKWFSYTPEDLEKFGIENIFYSISASHWVSSMRNKHVIFASYCKQE